MALVAVPQGYPPLDEKKPLKEPPPVIVTPCDPWPRPYYLENGLRRVAPYHYTYNTYCKERWRGRELLDIFASEFRDRPLEYYVRIICSGYGYALIDIERCHCTRSGYGKWQTGPDPTAHREKWRHYIPHPTPARASCYFVANIHSARG
jgi:hypothetical protein